MTPRKHGFVPFLLVMLLAAGLRGLVLWKFGHHLDEDRDHYRAIAQNIATGRGFSDPRTGEPTAYRPPLYPLLLSTLVALGGDRLSIGILQLLLGTATVGLTYAIGRTLGWRHRATAAALLVACDPLLLYNTALVMTETTATYLATLLLLLTVMVPAEGRRVNLAGLSGMLINWRPLLIGVVFGLCCLCRPTFWAWGVLLAISWLIDRLLDPSPIASSEDMPQPLEGIFHPSGMRPEAGGSNRATTLTRMQAGGTARGAGWKAVVGIACMVLPWIGRNLWTMGWPIATTTHGGYTLLLPHNPVYHRDVVERGIGTVWNNRSHRAWLEGLDEELARENPPLDVSRLSPDVEIARDRWMSATAWRIILNDPLMALRSGMTLLARLWNVVPLGEQTDAVSRGVLWGMGLFYAVLFIFMLAGLIMTLREWPLWAPPALLIASVTMVHMLYWADMRMRAPLVPAIALFAVAGMGRLPFAGILGSRKLTAPDLEVGSGADEDDSVIPPI